MTQKKNRPAGTGRLTTTTTTAASITALVCWRCGTPFAWTDLAALQRCSELARRTSEHRRPLRFEDIPREDW